MAALRGQRESGPRAPRPRHQRPVPPSSPEWFGPARAALRTGRHSGRHHCHGVGSPPSAPLEEKGASPRKPGLCLPRRPTAPSQGGRHSPQLARSPARRTKRPRVSRRPVIKAWDVPTLPRGSGPYHCSSKTGVRQRIHFPQRERSPRACLSLAGPRFEAAPCRDRAATSDTSKQGPSSCPQEGASTAKEPRTSAALSFVTDVQ